MKKLLILILFVPTFAMAQTNIATLPIFIGNLDSAKVLGSINGLTKNFWGVDLVKSRVKFTDTAAMFTGYPRVNRFTDSIALMRALANSRMTLAEANGLYVPLTRTLTINGTAFDLTANRSWTIAGGGGGDTTGLVHKRDSIFKYVTPTQLSTKQNTISLTTTGSSGAASLIGSTLNIPQYTGGGGSGTNLGYFNVVSYGADTTFTTDATAAIQSAINACHAAGGGTVYFPAGKYKIAGALQTSINATNPNSQLYIPLTAYSVDNGSHITLLGASPPNYLFNFNSGVSSGSGGAILISTIAGTGTTPAVFGTPTSPVLASPFNNTYVTMKNIVIRTTTNTGATHFAGTMSGINFENLSNFQFDQLSIEITSNFDAMANPVNETFGLIMPKQLNFGWTIGGVGRILGYRNLIVIGEHVNINQLYIAFGVKGLITNKEAQHSAVITNLSVESTKYNIWHSGEQNVYITTLKAEHHPSISNWYGFEYDVFVNGAITRGVYFGHVNLGTWGTVGATEYKFITNKPNNTSFNYLNARDVERDLVSVTTGSNVNAMMAKRVKINLLSNSTLTIDTARAGEIIKVLAVQDATGSRTLTVNSTSIPITATASAATLINCHYDGSLWYYSTQSLTSSGISYLLFDDFDRANSSTVLGSGSIGGAHTIESGTWGIITNKAYVSDLTTTGAVSPRIVSHSVASANYTLEATFNLNATNLAANASAVQIMFRMSDVTNYWLLDINSVGTGLLKREAGAYLQIGATNATANPVGTDITVKIVVSGNLITVFRNNVQIFTTTNTFNNTALKVGFADLQGAGYGGGTKFDNWKVY